MGNHGQRESTMPRTRSRYDGHAEWYDSWNRPSALRNASDVLDLLGPGEGLCLDLGCGSGLYFDVLAATGRTVVAWTPACILFWGHNPVLSGPDGETRFNVHEALAHNPRTIVVDPRRTVLAEKADLWLQVRPGADDALALAMLNVVIGEKLYDEPFVTQWTHGFAELAAHVGNSRRNGRSRSLGSAPKKSAPLRACSRKPSRPCWIGAAPSNTRLNASRPFAPYRCCRRSPAISTCRAAGCLA